LDSGSSLKAESADPGRLSSLQEKKNSKAQEIDTKYENLKV